MKKITALLLACALLCSAFALTACTKDEDESAVYSFAANKMKDLIELDKSDYYALSVTVDAEPEIDASDIDEFIDELLSASASTSTLTDTQIQKDDTVKIYYRGQVDGVDFDGGSNMTASTPDSLTIGSGSFIPGFEDSLLGVNPMDTAFTKITSGTVKDNYVLYVTYTATYTDETGAEQTKKVDKAERIDLASSAYSEAFLTALQNVTIGKSTTFTAENDVDGDGVSETAEYTLKISFASLEETVAVKAVFPDPYENNLALSGKEATFYVVVTEVARPVLPELNDDFILNTLGYVPEDEDAKGEALIAELRDYIKEILEEERNGTIRSAAIAKLWEHMEEAVEIKQYPEKALQDIKASAESSLEAEFSSYKQYYEYYGSQFPYESKEAFAPEYFGFEEDETYETGLDRVVKETALSQMLFYYIVQAEDYKLTTEEEEAGIADFIAYEIQQYAYYYGQTVTEEEVMEAYGEEAILEQVLYAKVMDELYESMDVTVNIVTEAE